MPVTRGEAITTKIVTAISTEPRTPDTVSTRAFTAALLPDSLYSAKTGTNA